MAPEIANRDVPFEIFADRLRWGAPEGSRLADDIKDRQARELGSSIGRFGELVCVDRESFFSQEPRRRERDG